MGSRLDPVTGEQIVNQAAVFTADPFTASRPG